MDIIFKEEDLIRPEKEMINLSDKRDSKWLEGVLDDHVRERDFTSALSLLLSIKEYKNADRVRKSRILDDVVCILSGLKCDGRDPRDIFRSLITKGLITGSDSSYCIKSFRDTDLYELIPLMILAENGFT